MAMGFGICTIRSGLPMFHSEGNWRFAGASFASPSGRSVELIHASRSALSRAPREQSLAHGLSVPSGTGAANHGGIWPRSMTRLIVFAWSWISARSSRAKGAMPPSRWRCTQGSGEDLVRVMRTLRGEMVLGKLRVDCVVGFTGERIHQKQRESLAREFFLQPRERGHVSLADRTSGAGEGDDDAL